MRRALTLAAVTAAATLFTAHLYADEKPAHEITAWARATPGGVKVGAAYGTIKPAADDRLIAVSTPAAKRSEIHTHKDEDGVMKMRRIDGLDVKSGQHHKLAPGGDHLMLFDLAAPLKEGDTLPLTLKFEKAGDVTVNASVKPIGARGSETDDRGSSSGKSKKKKTDHRGSH